MSGSRQMREIVWTGFLTVDGIMDSPGNVAEGHPAGGWVMRAHFCRRRSR